MQRTTITIDHGACDREGLCASLCPMRIFQHEEAEVPTVSDEQQCVLCGQCVAVCPHDAIIHGRLERARFRAIEEMADIDADVVASLLRQRRSVRNYRAKKAAKGFKVRSFTGLRELLGFPDHHEVFSAASLGYRGVKLHSTPDRRTSVRFIGQS